MKLISQIVNNNKSIVLFLFLVALGFRLWGITDQFEAWDETAIVRNGEINLNYIRNGDFSAESWSLVKEHPPFARYFYGATRIVSLRIPYFTNVLDQDYPLGRRYTFQRIVSAIIASLSVVLVFLLVKKFYNKKAGVISALILSFTPYFIGHSRIATQESLVAFLTLFAVYVFFLALKSKDLNNKLYLAAGLILGFAISTKFNAVFFLVLFAALAVLHFRHTFVKDWKKIFNNRIILIPIISFLTLYLMWPWLWPDPVGRILLSLSRIDNSRYLEYFLGQYPSPHPWYYFFVYFFAATSPVMLFGVVTFILKIIFRRGNYDLWFLLYFLTPFLASFSPLRMDGIRYIFPVYPALAIICGLSIDWLVNILKMDKKRKVKIAASYILPPLIVGYLVFLAVIYHPFYMDYYNSFAGGPKNVYEKRLFDFGYWGEGLRSAFRYLSDIADDKPITVYYITVPLHVTPDVSSNLHKIGQIEAADYVIINPTGEWIDDVSYLNFGFPEHFDLVYYENVTKAGTGGFYNGKIGVYNIPIVRIYKRNQPYGGQ